MKFLLDQDVYLITAQFLQSLGHDVLRVSELNLSSAPDELLLSTAMSLHRITKISMPCIHIGPGSAPSLIPYR